MTIAEQQSQIPRSAIRMVIDRLHVNTSDADIVADWTRRCDEAKLENSPVGLTDYQRRAIIRYALAAHHTNQQLVRDFRL
jgi:hypothetical protein